MVLIRFGHCARYGCEAEAICVCLQCKSEKNSLRPFIMDLDEVEKVSFIFVKCVVVVVGCRFVVRRHTLETSSITSILVDGIENSLHSI